MVCKLTGSQQVPENALKLAAKIKRAISKKFDYIRCSIGIAPNTFLAKTASNMQKPDGCVLIEQHELPHRLYGLQLRALNGIGKQMEARLNRYKITTVEQLYAANRQQLQSAWGSIEGERMYDKPVSYTHLDVYKRQSVSYPLMSLPTISSMTPRRYGLTCMACMMLC